MTTGTPVDHLELLRFTTAGSVDDGKSTLIGRLLYDTKSVCDDQIEAVEAASARLGEDQVNLALLTDGLRAEREQKITIDVAYRYFATRRRKFIIADTPGHLQYTRNMVTGASTADLAIVLIDASKGVVTQSRRHAFIASLLGIPHIIVAVNKMDLVAYAEDAFESVKRSFAEFAAKLTVKDIAYLPISALAGDNVVTSSARMPWYQGGPLLHRLETVHLSPRNAVDFRFPVQTVFRPNQSFRGYAGTVLSGSIGRGDEVMVLPARLVTTIKSIETFDGPLAKAAAGDAVVLTTNDELDISRGDMIVRLRNRPDVARRIDAYLCWMDATALVVGQSYLLAHTTRTVQAVVVGVEYRMDIDTLHRAAAATLGMNDIGRVEILTAEPVFVDSYRLNSATGSFVLIDAQTHATVAAGMIRGAKPWRLGYASGDTQASGTSGEVIRRDTREARHGHPAAVVWLTGLSGSGKTTLALALEKALFTMGHAVAVLDGDALRLGLCEDLGFSPEERGENIRRAGHVARLLFEQGAIVLCAFVSPYRADRDRVRALFPEGRFIEVHVAADLATCRARDVKGHYAKAAAGQLSGLTGLDAPYEVPESADLRIDTGMASVDACLESLQQLLRERQIVRSS